MVFPNPMVLTSATSSSWTVIHSGVLLLSLLATWGPVCPPVRAALRACILRSSGEGAVHLELSSADLSTVMCEGRKLAW